MKNTIFMLALAITLFSCEKVNDIISDPLTGAKKDLHHGKAWTWIKMDPTGMPDQLGITISDEALNSVPMTADPNAPHSHDNSIVLPLPEAALAVTPFRTVGLDWNPNGHPPANIYTKPHFDLHFYMLREAERQNATDPAKLNADPAADYLPLNHIGADPVPKMGKHWVDITSPEFDPANPGGFTQTFIYGSYDSKVVFYEPMITKAFLEFTSTFERPIPQPVKFKQTGNYPTKMKIIRHNGKTDIILEGFVKRIGQ